MDPKDRDGRISKINCTSFSFPYVKTGRTDLQGCSIFFCSVLSAFSSKSLIFTFFDVYFPFIHRSKKFCITRREGASLALHTAGAREI